MSWKTVWRFSTARFDIKLQVTPCDGQVYYSDDDTGEIRDRISSSEYQIFDSRVAVYLDDRMIGTDSLSFLVYKDPREFWTAHRDHNPMNRNCTAYRKVHGYRRKHCHYFPDMVRTAVEEARSYLSNAPAMRKPC